jgi:hypothetical protein
MTSEVFEPSPVPRFHGALRRRILLQLAFAALGALPAHAMASDPDSAPVPPPPVEGPPPPPRDLPEPPPEVAAQMVVDEPTPQPPAAPPVDGQWVYTGQYGWVWMPYAQSYTYVPADGNPSMFIYGPTLGWRWVSAPWVFDYGPAPYWGVRGRGYFSWYSRPWFARREYRPAYHHDYHPVYRHDYHPVYRRDYRPVDRRDYHPADRRDYRPADRRDYGHDGRGRGRAVREVHVHGHSGHRR